MPICATCAQDNPDIAKFCLACGAPLAAPVPTSEERKLITVLFTDIVGSTAKAENMDPEDVRARLAPYYVRLRGELERFGGTVEKFIGDAVVALFGAPVAHEDDPERAVRAAFAICNAIDELNAEDEWLDLKVRVGVNTGEALVVLGARASEGEGMAAGDVMNTAARLQSAAPVNGVLVGELTYEATRDVIDYHEAEPIAAKGKSEPVPVWEAIRVKEAQTAVTAEGVALVGREREVAALEEVWETALETRRPRLVTIVGPPGIGKSRLLVEFARRAEDDGGSVHWGRCLPYGEGITYWPVTELVKSAAGILQSDDRTQIAAKLDAFLETLGTEDRDELRTIASALSNLIGIPTTPRGTYTASEISQGELHWGIRRTMQLLAARRPTALVFEDLHWAEATLLELISYITADDADSPLALVCTARPDLADVSPDFLGTHGRRSTIELDTLGRAQAVALLSDLLADASLAETPFAAALIDNAGGNPLFLEETVRTLRDRGLVDPDRWRSEEVGELPVPTSVQGLISSRLDQLESAEKRLAHHASVVGAVFWAGAVAHLGIEDGQPPKDPRPGLASLERRDFVAHSAVSSVADEDEYAFKHILMRDVAYGQIPKGRRAQLHVRFSDWVTVLPGSAEEFVEIVAWHLEQACRLSREVARSPIEPPLLQAAGALANAARRAELREGLREARRYYARALDVLGDTYPETAVELRLRRAIAMAELGELKGASEELFEVDRRAALCGRPDVRAEALVAHADIDQRQGRATEAHDRLARADAIARETDDRRLRVKAAFILSALRADLEGQFVSAVEELRRALTISEELNDLALRVEGHLRIGFLLYNMGELESAESELLRCTSLARELGSHRDEARATFQLSLVKHYRGSNDEAERLALQARDWLERTGDTYMQVQNLHALARFALSRDDAELAEARLMEGLEIAVEIGGWLAVDTYRLLTKALVRQCRTDDAKTLVDLARRNLPAEDFYARAAVTLADAAIATALGARDRVVAAYDEAISLLEELNMAVEVAEACTDFGCALATFGDTEGARVQLERAQAVFTQIGAVTREERFDREAV